MYIGYLDPCVYMYMYMYIYIYIYIYIIQLLTRESRVTLYIFYTAIINQQKLPSIVPPPTIVDLNRFHKAYIIQPHGRPLRVAICHQRTDKRAPKVCSVLRQNCVRPLQRRPAPLAALPRTPARGHLSAQHRKAPKCQADGVQSEHKSSAAALK